MQKDKKNTTNVQLKNAKQSQAEQTLKETDNIKDYDRAWEDDRL